MAEIILEKTGMQGGEAFHTIHNYIDVDEMILRKGAIAAHKDENKDDNPRATAASTVIATHNATSLPVF